MNGGEPRSCAAMHNAGKSAAHHRTDDRWTRGLLFVYLLVLIWIVLFKFGVHFAYMDERAAQFVPYGGLLAGKQELDLSEILLNVAIFVPLGLYLGYLYRQRGYGWKLLLSFLLSLSLETTQYLFQIGAFDATDLVNNTLGAAMGLLVSAALLRAKPERGQFYLNLVSTVATVLMVAFLVSITLGVGPIRYQ